MKIFTVEHFQELTQEGQAHVSDWLTKYSLENTIMVLQTEDEDGKVVVAVYSDTPVRVMRRGRVESYYAKALPDSLIKAAEFDYDDFPWDVLK